MAVICSTEYSTDHFTILWEGGVCKLVSEISETPVSRVFDDACDEGFWVRSIKTGNRVCFAVWDVKRDSDGEILSWELVPLSPSGRPDTARQVRVVLFND
jgi:hypothetical protein